MFMLVEAPIGRAGSVPACAEVHCTGQVSLQVPPSLHASSWQLLIFPDRGKWLRSMQAGPTFSWRRSMRTDALEQLVRLYVALSEEDAVHMQEKHLLVALVL